MSRATLALVLLGLPLSHALADSPAPILGLDLGKIPEALYAQLPKVPSGHGLLVEKVAVGSAGERLGIRRYDILLSVDGADLKDAEHFARMLFAVGKGSKLTLLRAGKEITMPLTITDMDLPKGVAKLGGLPDVTIKADVLDKNKLAVTLIYFRDDSGKRESVTVTGTHAEVCKQVDDLASNHRMPQRVHDLVEVALKRLRGLNDAQEK